MLRPIADILLLLSIGLQIDSVRVVSRIIGEFEVPGGRRWQHLRVAIVTVIALTGVFLVQCMSESRVHPGAVEDLIVAAAFLVLGIFGRAVLSLTRQAIRDARLMSGLEQVSRLDHLTGIANRRHLDVVLRAAIADAYRRRLPLSLLMIDIDHFKAVNDTHGHQAGDRALRAVVASIAAHLRPCDLISRFGGDEIVVVLPGATGQAGREAAERIGSAIRMQADDAATSVTISSGIAVLQPGDTAAFLLDRADQALYAAKRGGRDQSCLYGEGETWRDDDASVPSNRPAQRDADTASTPLLRRPFVERDGAASRTGPVGEAA